jgi:hypothetical protein
MSASTPAHVLLAVFRAKESSNACFAGSIDDPARVLRCATAAKPSWCRLHARLLQRAILRQIAQDREEWLAGRRRRPWLSHCKIMRAFRVRHRYTQQASMSSSLESSARDRYSSSFSKPVTGEAALAVRLAASAPLSVVESPGEPSWWTKALQSDRPRRRKVMVAAGARHPSRLSKLLVRCRRRIGPKTALGGVRLANNRQGQGHRNPRGSDGRPIAASTRLRSHYRTFSFQEKSCTRRQ